MNVISGLAYKNALAMLLVAVLTPVSLVEAQEGKGCKQREGCIARSASPSEASAQHWTAERMRNAKPHPHPSSPQPQVPQPTPASSSEANAPGLSSQEPSLSYWTPERMRNAKPLPLPHPSSRNQ